MNDAVGAADEAWVVAVLGGLVVKIGVGGGKTLNVEGSLAALNWS